MTKSLFHKLVPALISGLATLGACSGESRFGVEQPRVEIVRLDKAVAALSDTASLDQTADDGAAAWLYVTRGLPVTSLLPSTRDSILLAEKEGRAFTLFEKDVERLLPSLKDEQRVLGLITGLPARIYGMVSPYNQSVIIVDTTVIVSLNHYLGPDYEGYATFPEYIRRNKTIDRLPIDVAEAWIRNRFPLPDSLTLPTLLQQMAYEGAVLAETADELKIPDGPRLMGWTQEEWNSALANEKEAWRRIVGNEMLFSDDAALVRRLTAPAPSSPDVSQDAPGRLGRFVGLRMIRALNLSPEEILSGKMYLESSIASDYARKVAN